VTSTYRLLEDHAIAGTVLPAGTTQSTADVGGLLPVGRVPTPNVDPLDAPALAAFYAQGRVLPGPIVTQFSTIGVSRPVTFWSRQGNGQYALGGLGAALARVWPWRI
jgi:hypothetical protein